MITAKHILPTAAAMLAILLIAGPWSILIGAPEEKSPAGTWIMRYGFDEGNNWSYPLYRVESVTPVEPSGLTLNYVGVDTNPWGSGGPAPGGHVSDHVGTLTWMRPNTYTYTIIYQEAAQPGFPPYCPGPPCVERAKLTVIWVWKGTATVSGDTLVKDGTFMGYDAAVSDLNKDGLPDAGATPFYEIPWKTTSARVK